MYFVGDTVDCSAYRAIFGADAGKILTLHAKTIRFHYHYRFLFSLYDIARRGSYKNVIVAESFMLCTQEFVDGLNPIFWTVKNDFL